MRVFLIFLLFLLSSCGGGDRGLSVVGPGRSDDGNQSAGEGFGEKHATYRISGTVKNGDVPLPWVTVTLTGALSSVVTTSDASGNWSFDNLTNHSTYTVTPTSPDFDFYPLSETKTIESKDIKVVDFETILQNRVIFLSSRDGNSEIYSMNAKGENQTRLTHDPSEDGDPSLSLDHGWIAFSSKRDGNFEIYRMNMDGTGLMRLTNDPGMDWAPSWSGATAPHPFTDKVLFVSTRTGRHEIWMMSPDGTDQQQVTDTDEGLYTLYPSMARAPSLDGWVLVVSSDAQSKGTMNEDILYIKDVEDEDLPIPIPSKIKTKRKSVVVAMTRTPEINETEPRISPNGRYIAYTRQAPNNTDILRCTFSGRETENLTHSAKMDGSGFPAWDQTPSWSAFGNTILFASDRKGGSLQIFGMLALTGEILRTYTNSTGENWWPSRRK
ncbi:MAG: PD40 domain-containing protein [Armatimonadetes bacterium]|nr:PD40 domain-containing protein [Armatimonadota bacterium]